MAEQHEEQDLEGAWTISGQELLNAIWPILLRDQAKLKQLASTPAFVTPLLQDPAFCAGVTKTASSAATKSVGSAMGA